MIFQTLFWLLQRIFFVDFLVTPYESKSSQRFDHFSDIKILEILMRVFRMFRCQLFACFFKPVFFFFLYATQNYSTLFIFATLPFFSSANLSLANILFIKLTHCRGAKGSYYANTSNDCPIPNLRILFR